jgi:hypothetical protein
VFIHFEDRSSDSPFVERIWRSHSTQAGVFHSMAACHWEMVVTRCEGRTTLTVRGPETFATAADCPAEGEWIGIRFKLGTFMPHLRPSVLRDRQDVTLPNASSRSFWLRGSVWQFPSFENAENFVQQLVNNGLVAVDPCVNDVLRGYQPAITSRTCQRRFLQATGITHNAIRQIERARHATNLLQQGASILDAAFAAGFYDQPHLNRSLKRLIGQTPAQILRAEQQLSFLYNTQPAEALMV